MAELSIYCDTGKAILQQLHHREFEQTKIQVDVLRLDLIHPVISGNKWFKLKYHIAEALEQNKQGIISFGGAYSNHLVALAYVCRQSGLSCTGIIRGEAPAHDNPSLQQMREYGMELIFESRDNYIHKESLFNKYLPGHPGYYYVPEGGSSIQGIQGAEDILKLLPANPYSHIVCAVGTGTTLTGIINGSSPEQQVLGVASLKISDVYHNDIIQYIGRHARHNNYSIRYDYHFGGYARKTDELIRFMNELFRRHLVPTDLVYTSKLFYAVSDQIKKGYFTSGDHILVIHTGGLQGNRSLPPGTLVF